jgi:hypothetical protein
MIFNEATFDTFGYFAEDISSKSSKFIVAVCDKCSNIRIIRRYSYHDLCLSCSHKGNTSGRGNRGRTFTEEAKANMSAAQKGKTFTEDHKVNISESKRGKKNEEKKHLNNIEKQKKEEQIMRKSKQNADRG